MQEYDNTNTEADSGTDNKKGYEKHGQSFWDKELVAANKRVKKFHSKGGAIVDRYIGKGRTDDILKTSRLNLFHSNVKTLQSMLYGNLPKVDVSRRYADGTDDAARVAAEIFERLLNLDVQENGKDYDAVLRSCLQDRLLPGLGCARVSYEVETEEMPDPMTGEMVEQIVSEAAPLTYYFWKDMLWSWGRNFSTLRWIAFRNDMDKKVFVERFGEDATKNIEFKEMAAHTDADGGDIGENDKDVIKKVEVWEIWCKDTKQVYWYTKGAQKLLDTKDDTLGLKGFFPCPPFFMANATTTDYMPTADFVLNEDIYNQIDLLETRINKITEAVKVVGVYDKSSTGVKNMLKEATENELIPVDNWAMFGEKGGLQGQIDWLPVEEIANTLNKLVQQRDQQIALLQQTSGMADIMQGGLANQYEGVGQTNQKAKFGSVRVQALQDEFATFATDLMQLKAEIIEKHFEPQTIVTMSNIANSMAADEIGPAMEIIKNPDMPFRVEIRPESVAMVDFAELKNERTEFMSALSMFLQSAGPMIEKDPTTTPYLLKMLQWTMAGFKGASEIEGVLDKAIEAAIMTSQKAINQPEPDPAAAQEQAKMQSKLQEIQAKAQADMAVREADKQADIAVIQAQMQADMGKIGADNQADMAEIQAKMQASIQTEMATSQVNIEQNMQAVNGEMQKDLQKMQLEMEKLSAAASIDIQKEATKAEIEIEKDRNE